MKSRPFSGTDCTLLVSRTEVSVVVTVSTATGDAVNSRVVPAAAIGSRSEMPYTAPACTGTLATFTVSKPSDEAVTVYAPSGRSANRKEPAPDATAAYTCPVAAFSALICAPGTTLSEGSTTTP